MKIRLPKIERKLKIALTAVLFLLVLFIASRVVFWLFAFILLASIAEIYNTYFRTPFHLDLIKIGTILAAVVYGPWQGIFVGLSSTLFSKIFSSRLDFTIMISFGGIIIMAVLASIFASVSITLLGIALVLLYYLMVTPIHLLMGDDPAYAAIYVLSSLVVNIILFTQVAPRIIGLL